MKEQILQLRQEGKTYTEIQKILNCSKSTISYYCGIGQKEKNKIRTQNLRKSSKHIAKYKVDTFIGRTLNNKLPYNKVYISRDEKHSAMVEKVLKTKNCYLTGREIDLTNGDSYHLDHINPYFESENNDIENMGIACKDANMSKSYLSLKDYLKLCVDVLEHHGYKVLKE